MAMVLALWVVFSGAASVTPQASHYRVGVLISRSPFHLALDGLREGLAQLGYREGENLAFVVEDAQGNVPGLASHAAKLVAAKPDVVFTISTASTTEVKQATTTLPIVFTVVADPLRAGLIVSYASSQNNLTGVTNSAAPLSGKRLDLLKTMVPGVKHALVLVAPQENVSEVSFTFLVEAAPRLGIELLRRDVSSRAEIEQTLQALPQGAIDAIYHVPSNLVGAHIDLLIQRAIEDRIPLSVHEDAMVAQGALISYGADIRLLGRQAAKLVAKILTGVKPAEIPVQTAEKPLLVINLSTAKAIGLDIPRAILEQTDRFVE
jgi:putative tryptophan/tyrosine transport system substrate-binding protein